MFFAKTGPNLLKSKEDAFEIIFEGQSIITLSLLRAFAIRIRSTPHPFQKLRFPPQNFVVRQSLLRRFANFFEPFEGRCDSRNSFSTLVALNHSQKGDRKGGMHYMHGLHKLWALHYHYFVHPKSTQSQRSETKKKIPSPITITMTTQQQQLGDITNITHAAKKAKTDDGDCGTQPKRPHPALMGSLIPPETYKGPIMNFSPGPTSLPREVESEIQTRCFADLNQDCYQKSRPRLSTMAMSHRSPEFGVILEDALRVLRQVMEIPDEYEILFAHGGGHGQFAAVPLNLCFSQEDKATYIINGTWGERAIAEARKYCTPIALSSKNETTGNYEGIPTLKNIDPESKFVYLCSNETVNGSEFQTLPKLNCNVPLVVDASSDFSSKPIDWRGSNVGVLFACASKNVGHPGVTLVVIRKDLLGHANPFCPGFMNYKTNIEAGNLWNTIATFNVHVVGILMEWIEHEGGIREMERRSIAKSQLIYNVIDRSKRFYSCPIADPKLRSRMNVPFDIAEGDEFLTNLFLIEASERGIVGLRTLTPFGVGQYLRASFYHGVTEEYAMALAEFMTEFAEINSPLTLGGGSGDEEFDDYVDIFKRRL